MWFFIVSLCRRRSRVRVIKVTPACRKWSSGDNIALVSRVSNEDTEVSLYLVLVLSAVEALTKNVSYTIVNSVNIVNDSCIFQNIHAKSA